MSGGVVVWVLMGGGIGFRTYDRRKEEQIKGRRERERERETDRQTVKQRDPLTVHRLPDDTLYIIIMNVEEGGVNQCNIDPLIKY